MKSYLLLIVLYNNVHNFNFKKIKFYLINFSENKFLFCFLIKLN